MTLLVDVERWLSYNGTCHVAGLGGQLDARPTGDQEVAGSTPTGSATFFRGDLIMKYFLRSFSHFL